MLFQSDRFGSSQRAVMVITVSSWVCDSCDSINSRNVFVTADDGQSSCRGLLVIFIFVSVGKQPGRVVGREVVIYEGNREVSALTIKKKESPCL